MTAGIVAELAEPFDRMTAPEASAALLDLYGIEAVSLERLDTERDDTFRVSSASGGYVFKIAHPADDPLYVNLQTAAMSYVAEDPSIPVQSLVLTLDGEIEPVVAGRVARLLTWLEGVPLGAPTQPQLEVLGATLGRVSSALATFAHPAAQRTFAWDLQSFAELRALPHPAVADVVFDRFAELDLGSLPHQVIHNDFHPGNVLVDEADPRFVVGVLDFGDVLHSARVVDLGVSLAYLLPEEGSPGGVVDPFLAGYESVVPLTPDERDAIETLVAARLVQRIILPPILSRDTADDATIARTTRVLENFLKEI